MTFAQDELEGTADVEPEHLMCVTIGDQDAIVGSDEDPVRVGNDPAPERPKVPTKVRGVDVPARRCQVVWSRRARTCRVARVPFRMAVSQRETST